MHNNIMAAGSRDRPPMLATGRYAQWRSCFLRYIDTRPNGDALRKCILEGPYTPSTVIIPAIAATENSPAVPKRTIVETILNMSPENKAHFEFKKEAIHLLLTGIGDEIYSTIDACKIAHEIWEAIKRLQQGESLNIQDVKTNLFWDFGKFTSHDVSSATLTRMVKEVNEIHAKRIAKNANPLALIAATQQYPDPYYEAPKSYKPYAPTSKQSSSIRSNATTKFKGKEIAKPITPPSELAFKEDNTTPRHKNDNQTGQFGNQRIVNVVGAKETVCSQVVHQTGIQCFNYKEFGHFAKEYMKPKRVIDSTYHKEKILLCKQAEKDLGTDSEPLKQVQYDVGYNVFANEIQHSEKPESSSTTCVVEKGDSIVILDLPYMCDNDIQNDQNVVECDDERVTLANLIGNLKLDVDENKKIQKQLKKANTSLAHELTKCKFILAKTSKTLGESNSIRNSCLVVIQNKQTEFERYKTLNDCTVDYEKLEHKLNETLGLLAQKDIDIKEGLKLKAYEILVVKEKHDELVKQSLLTKSHYEGLVK
ncbi:hypothetical protein Tco_0039991 [Tanacetum coccineum]